MQASQPQSVNFAECYGCGVTGAMAAVPEVPVAAGVAAPPDVAVVAVGATGAVVSVATAAAVSVGGAACVVAVLAGVLVGAASPPHAVNVIDTSRSNVTRFMNLRMPVCL